MSSPYNITEVILYFIERVLKLRLPLDSRRRWKINLNSEIRFWDRWFKTRGLTWPEEYQRRLDPGLLLQNEVKELLPPAQTVKILDVGAGPLTALGKICPGKTLQITAVDPLADRYDKLLQKYEVIPLIRTAKLDAEWLTTQFPENHFDLVYARNCIDHSYSPERAILEMIKVTRPGCHILLLNRPEEAKQEDWKGLHQWNFNSVNGHFIISSRNTRLNFSEKYAALCHIDCQYHSEDDMLHIRILKTGRGTTS